MSDSPTDIGADWTFLPPTPEPNEDQIKATSIAENANCEEAKCVDAAEISAECGTEKIMENEDPVNAVNDDEPSEGDSMSSSDVDILEESVGPDHDILTGSSTSHTSSFSISCPLDGIMNCGNTGTMDAPSKLPEIKKVCVEIKDICHNQKSSIIGGTTTDLLEKPSGVQSVLPTNSCYPLPRVKCAKSTLQGRGTEPKLSKPKPQSEDRDDATVWEEISRMIDRRVAIIYCSVWILLFCAFLGMFSSLKDKPFLSTKSALEVHRAQNEVLKCLGLQHITALESNHYGMLLSNVCVNDSEAWKNNFEIFMKDPVLRSLIIEIYNQTLPQRKTEITEVFVSDHRNGVQGIKFDLILHQLEFLEMISNVDDTKEADAGTTIVDVISEKLEEQEILLGRLQEFIDQLKLANFALESVELKLKAESQKNPDLDLLKPKIYRLKLENVFLSDQLQNILNQFESGEFLNPSYRMSSFSSATDGLLEKVNQLLSSNEMRREIGKGKASGTSPSDGQANAENGSSKIDSTSINMLVKELLELHKTLTLELADVKQNKMFSNVAEDLQTSSGNGYCVWSSIKSSFRQIFSCAQKDLSQSVKNIKNLVVSGLFQKYGHEGDQPMKNMYESLANIWETTHAKGRKLLEKALHEIHANFLDSEMFASEDQQEVTPTEEIHHEAEEPYVQENENTEVVQEENLEKQAEFQENLNPYQSTTSFFEKSPKGMGDMNDNRKTSSSEKSKWKKFKSDWLFQRAADRENLRQVAKARPMNWYLRRGHNLWRSAMTQEQEELLEKMEVAQYPSLKKPDMQLENQGA